MHSDLKKLLAFLAGSRIACAEFHELSVPLPAKEGSAMAKATILIVEDSPDIADPLADAFRFDGFEVLQAANAIQALQIASEHRPDLIFMDIQLPDMDGLAVARTLKSDPAVAHIPIVAMTAFDIVGDQARTIGKICVGYAQKPIRARELINLASAILKLPGDPEPPRRIRPPARPHGR
jgi:two-component system cell cycle response regulator DivK